MLGFAQETLKASFIQVHISFYVSEVTFAEGTLQEQIKEISMVSNRDNQCLQQLGEFCLSLEEVFPNDEPIVFMVLRLLKAQSISLWLGQGLQGARGILR